MNRYKQARLKAGLTQKAAAFSLGVQPPSMSDWENGKSQPTYEHLVSMAKLYNTSTDYLTGADIKLMDDSDKCEELKKEIILRIDGMSEQALVRVLDFISGMEAARNIT